MAPPLVLTCDSPQLSINRFVSAHLFHRKASKEDSFLAHFVKGWYRTIWVSLVPLMRQNSSSDDLPRLVACPLCYKYHPASWPEVTVIFFHNWFPFYCCIRQFWFWNGNVTQCSAGSLELLSTLLTRCGEQLWICSLFSFGQMRKDCISLRKVFGCNWQATHTLAA